jgi:hypothetical protein
MNQDLLYKFENLENVNLKRRNMNESYGSSNKVNSLQSNDCYFNSSFKKQNFSNQYESQFELGSPNFDGRSDLESINGYEVFKVCSNA